MAKSKSSDDAPFVISGKDAGPGNLDVVGGKAAELGRLLSLGFSVPPFFCVTTHAFARFLDESELALLADRSFEDVHWQDIRYIEKKSEELQQKIRKMAVPEDIVQAVVSACAGLDEAAGLCVRSSALAEDLAGASFAGQYDTVLNVRGETEIIDALRSCWASAFNPWAVQYRLKNRVPAGGFGVVVQEMVPADCAGVAFTSHPVTGDPGEVVIDAVFGMGEALVSGRVAPDQYVVPKDGKSPVRIEIGDKTEAWLPADDESGHLRRVTLDDVEKRNPVLTEAEARKVARMAQDVEKVYGAPRDIEWAKVKDRCFLLQARPITATGSAIPEGWEPGLNTPIPGRFPTYSNGNISEVLPGVISPLSWSLAGPNLEYAFRKPCIEMGIIDEARDMPETWIIVGFFYHRPYLNISFFRHIADITPGMSRDSVDEEFLGKKREGKTPIDKTVFLPRSWPKLFRIIKTLIAKPGEIKQNTDFIRRRIVEERERLAARPATDYSPEALLDKVGSQEEPYDLLATHIWASEFAVVGFDMLRQFTGRFLDDANGMIASRLVTGLAQVESAKPSLALWRLSRRVHGSEELKALFARFTDMELYFELSRAEKGTEAAGFFGELEEFLTAYGHRGILEAELMNPTWREDPSYVIGIVRNYASASPDKDPARIDRRQAGERMKAEREARYGLNPFLRPIFSRALGTVRKYIMAREEIKALLIELGSVVRPYLLTLASVLTREGWIQTSDDIHYLTIWDLEDIRAGRAEKGEIRELVQVRRRDFELCQRVRMPNVIENKAVPVEEEEVSHDGDRLCGLGVSPGRVTGKARVILDPRADCRIEHGEILVAPVTDAGWAPLFLSASALVVDIGGMLSHGSVVAREYGLPTVVNVKIATKTIKTGDTITVDGDRGEVYLSHVC